MADTYTDMPVTVNLDLTSKTVVRFINSIEATGKLPPDMKIERLTITGTLRVKQSVTVWSPLQLFTGGVDGAWFEPTAAEIDTTATSGIKVTGYSQRMGRWHDRSGNNRDVYQTNDATRPTFALTTDNLPCVDYLNQHGLRNASDGGGALTSMYGCIAIEIPTTSSGIWSDVNAANVGVRLVYDAPSGGVFLVAGNGTTTVQMFKSAGSGAGPLGRQVIQWWYEAGTMNFQVGTTTATAAAVTLAAGGPGFGIGGYYDGVAAVWNAKIYCHVHTKNSVPSAADRSSMYAYALAKITPSTSSTVADSALPNKVLSCYFTLWDLTYPLTSVPLIFNTIHLFHAVPLGDGSGAARFDYDYAISAATIQQVRARGQKVILTFGGFNAGFNFDTRAKSQAFVTSIITIINRLGGFDGLDFNNFEQNVGSSSTEMIWIAQQLRLTYGNGFAITAPPSVAGAFDRTLLTTMANANVLTCCGPQFYDRSDANDPVFIKTKIDEWVALIGADRVMVGLPAYNYNGLGVTKANQLAAYSAIEAAHPTIRGAFVWSSQFDLANGSDWGNSTGALVF